MQSRKFDFIALTVALAVALACALLAWLGREGNAALLLEFIWGAALGFVFPRGAWRWALILALWVPLLLAFKVALVPSTAFSWCPQPALPTDADSVPLPMWTLALIPFIFVYAGVAADWILTEALRWLAFLRWPWLDRAKPTLRIAAGAGAILIVLGMGLLLAQPLHPYAVGENYCWDEYCFAVTQVKRTKSIGSGSQRVAARGTFYIVTADMQTPWWGRFTWSNDAVYAIDYTGADYRYSREGQRALDEQLKTARSQCHQILGAGETETIVFDLPDDVVQPRLLVRDTLGFEGLLGGVRLSLFYVKPAFNLRYD